MRLCISEGTADQYGKRIASLSPQIGIVRLNYDGSFDPSADGIEVFYLSEDFWGRREAFRGVREIVEGQALKWFHTSSAGIDNRLFQRILERGVTLTHSPGLYARPIAEWLIGYMLHHVKRMPAHAQAQAAHEWSRQQSEELTGKTVGIVGYGGIGQEVARLAKAFEMRVVATKRTPVEHPNVDVLLPPDQLVELLAVADFVVLATPLTEETRGLIGAAELAAMKPGAVLLNVSRGKVVDEPALVEALTDGTIAAAVLDVTDSEPLPPESPLWDLPNCVITPHDSGESPQILERGGEIFLKNLSRYLQGQPLLDAVAATS